MSVSSSYLKVSVCPQKYVGAFEYRTGQRDWEESLRMAMFLLLLRM